MAAPGKKPGLSKWGSFMNVVNVVESKLDTILQDQEDTPNGQSAAATSSAAAISDKKQIGAVNGKGSENGMPLPSLARIVGGA